MPDTFVGVLDSEQPQKYIYLLSTAVGVWKVESKFDAYSEFENSQLLINWNDHWLEDPGKSKISV